MIDLPPKVVAAIDECSKRWGAPTVARQHMAEMARLAIEEARPAIIQECAERAAWFWDCYSPDDAGPESLKQWILELKPSPPQDGGQ